MRKPAYIWDRKWINNYISNWCIFERFRFSNALSNNDILHILGNKNIERLKNVSHAGEYLRDLSSLRGIDSNKTKEILKIDLIKGNIEFRNSIKSIIGSQQSINDLIKDNLHYCPKCIKYGFHSVFHQLSFLKTCVFHPSEVLLENCPKCESEITKHLITSDLRSPFTCKCGYNLMENNNIISIFENWRTQIQVKDKDLIKLIKLNKEDYDLPEILYPSRYATDSIVNRYALVSPELFIKFSKHYYLNKELDEKTIYKRYIDYNNSQGNFPLQSILNNYRNTFKYIFTDEYIPLKPAVIIDSVYYDVYIHSRHIYKSIKKYIKRELLNNHIKCIHLNNELKENNAHCKFAMAYTLWREEFEDINLSDKVKQAPIKTALWNFQRNKERFTLYPKGRYCYYLEDFLDSIFKFNNTEFNEINVTKIKNIVNVLLPYLLLESLSEYLDLFENNSKYSSVNYVIPNIIPLYIVVEDQDNMETTIYTHNTFLSLKSTVSRMEKSHQSCKFDDKKKYPSYTTPSKKVLEILYKNRNDFNK